MTETIQATRKRYVGALVAEAIRLEMARDRKVLLLGEDVGELGGVFGSSRGLWKEFGTERVRDTPIAEMSFTGMGVGLALAGYRPIVEIQFVDFIGVCLEQIFNEMAKIPYMSGGRAKVPAVVKTAGGILGSAAQHSQCLWGTLAHLPGMKVVVPSNPYDFKGLMASAIADDDPVVYIEHKNLLLWTNDLFPLGSEVPEERFTVPIGEAATVREGGDVTIATLGMSVVHALAAADQLASDGVEAEVIDLRSVVPLDADHVAASVARTGKLLVVDEDYLSFGLTGELITRVLERIGPAALRGFARLAVPDVPIPAALTLEEAVLPSANSIADAAKALAKG